MSLTLDVAAPQNQGLGYLDQCQVNNFLYFPIKHAADGNHEQPPSASQRPPQMSLIHVTVIPGPAGIVNLLRFPLVGQKYPVPDVSTPCDT